MPYLTPRPWWRAIFCSPENIQTKIMTIFLQHARRCVYTMCIYGGVFPLASPAGGGITIDSLGKPRDKAKVLNFCTTSGLTLRVRAADKYRNTHVVYRRQNCSGLHVQTHLWACLTIKCHLCVLSVENLVLKDHGVVSVVCFHHSDVLHHVMAWEKSWHRSEILAPLLVEHLKANW